MSQDGDKNKSDYNFDGAANNVFNPENGGETNKTNTGTTATNTMLNNKQNSSNGLVNNGKSENFTPIRENMVMKATEFLTSPLVQNSSVENKVNFLRKKGLTNQEINVSLQIASTQSNNLNNNHPQPSPYYNNSSNMTGAVQIPLEKQSWYKRLFGPIALAASVVYIAYQLYKKYIENWLFGVRKSPIEIRLEGVESSMHRCLMLLEKKNNSPDFSIENSDHKMELDQIRAELKTIKSLLLNKSQFPPPPVASSIPLWQLLKSTKQQQAEQQNKVNGSDTPLTLEQKPDQTNNVNPLNSLQQSVSNGGTYNNLEFVRDNRLPTFNESPFDTASSMTSDQVTIIKNDNEVCESNES